MDIQRALRTLQLEGTPTLADVRAAHRQAIVRSHPDTGGDDALAADINRAFDVLRVALESGEPLAPTPTARASTPPRDVILREDPTDLLMRMADAAHDIGEVVFADPLAGLLEVIVGEPPGVGQLTAAIGDNGIDGVPVSFTLEPLGIAAAPPIHDVVSDLMKRVRPR